MKLAQLGLIVAFALWFCAPGHSAQSNQAAQNSAGPKTALTITQERSYPDGHVGEIHLVQEKTEWSEALHGYLVALRASEKELALISLDADDLQLSDFTVATVQNQKQFTPTDLHTDLKLTHIEGKTDTGQQILEYSGKLTVCMTLPNSPDGQSKLFSLAGRPGTRIDLSALYDLKQELNFLGRSWRPTKDKDAIMVVGENVIQTMNVKVMDNK